jgi:hydrogenase assembly chaperone HypC/HupF
MCLTLPGRVVALDALGATIETDGRLRRASTIVVPEVEVGDWVLVGMGTILQRLEPEAAAQMRETLLEAIALEDAELERPRPAIPAAGDRARRPEAGSAGKR